MNEGAAVIIAVISSGTAASILGPVVQKWLGRRSGVDRVVGDTAAVQTITLAAARAQQAIAEQLARELAAQRTRAEDAERAAERSRMKWREAEQEADHLIERLRRVTNERDVYGETLDRHDIPRPQIA